MWWSQRLCAETNAFWSRPCQTRIAKRLGSALLEREAAAQATDAIVRGVHLTRALRYGVLAEDGRIERDASGEQG